MKTKKNMPEAERLTRTLDEKIFRLDDMVSIIHYRRNDLTPEEIESLKHITALIDEATRIATRTAVASSMRADKRGDKTE